MKLNLTVKDLESLTFSQKQTLNSLWLPAVYDRAVASVCKDVENDIYENLEFVVGEVILSEKGSITLKRLRIPDDFEADEEFSDGQDSSEDVVYDYVSSGIYFLRRIVCHYNIGQLINCLRNKRQGKDGFSLDIPPSAV